MITTRKTLTAIALLAILCSFILLVGKLFGFWDINYIAPLMGSFSGLFLAIGIKTKYKQED